MSRVTPATRPQPRTTHVAHVTGTGATDGAGQSVETLMRNRFRHGDRNALGELYDEHAQVLYRYALRVTGDWAEAEDVVSVTFLEAWRSREKLHPGGDSLRPWLLGIATNIMRRNARTHAAP